MTKAPDMTRGRPPGHQPGNRPPTEDGTPQTTTNAVPLQGPGSAAIVRQGGGKRRKAPTSRVPVAFASAYEPCKERDQWGFTYVCGWCGLGHFGRAKTEDEITGSRRSRCGRQVVIRVARVYRARAGAAT